MFLFGVFFAERHKSQQSCTAGLCGNASLLSYQEAQLQLNMKKKPICFSVGKKTRGGGVKKNSEVTKAYY